MGIYTTHLSFCWYFVSPPPPEAPSDCMIISLDTGPCAQYCCGSRWETGDAGSGGGADGSEFDLLVYTCSREVPASSADFFNVSSKTLKELKKKLKSLLLRLQRKSSFLHVKTRLQPYSLTCYQTPFYLFNCLKNRSELTPRRVIIRTVNSLLKYFSICIKIQDINQRIRSKSSQLLHTLCGPVKTLKARTLFASEHLAQNTSPQALQWCLRFTKLNLDSQNEHISLCLSSTQRGSTEPKINHAIH